MCIASSYLPKSPLVLLRCQFARSKFFKGLFAVRFAGLCDGRFTCHLTFYRASFCAPLGCLL
jgi:hypothetical protein